MSEVEWRPLPWDSRYLVSNKGEVIGARGRLLTQTDKNGYKLVGVPSPPGSGRSRLAHRVVLETFVGPCPPGMEASHKNHIRSDNRVENLEWISKSENCLMRSERRAYAKGENIGWSKLTDDQVREIKTWPKWERGDQIAFARKFAVHHTTIRDIRQRKVWRHVE